MYAYKNCGSLHVEAGPMYAYGQVLQKQVPGVKNVRVRKRSRNVRVLANPTTTSTKMLGWASATSHSRGLFKHLKLTKLINTFHFIFSFHVQGDSHFRISKMVAQRFCCTNPPSSMSTTGMRSCESMFLCSVTLRLCLLLQALRQGVSSPNWMQTFHSWVLSCPKPQESIKQIYATDQALGMNAGG